jgi:anti-anti-sigma factor
MTLKSGFEAYDGVTIFSLEGDLDYGECAGFRRDIDDILRNPSSGLILDLSQLAYMDSSGLGLMLSLRRKHGALGGRLLVVTNESVDNIFSLTRLTRFFDTAPVLADAISTMQVEVDSDRRAEFRKSATVSGAETTTGRVLRRILGWS